jgi:hypothetical protein
MNVRPWALIAGLLLACSGSDEASSDAPSSTSPTVLEYQMGDPVEPEADLFVQVFGYEPLDPVDGGVAAGGSRLVVIDVEACVTAARDDGERVDASDFDLVMPDGTRRGRTSTEAKEPVFRGVSFASGGDCVRGFVTFTLPLGVTARFVEYTAARPAIRWSIGAQIEGGH